MMRMILGLWVMLGLHPPADLHAGADPGSAIVAEDEHYRVELAGAGEPWYDPGTGGRVKFTFSVTEKAGGRRYPVHLDNLTSKIDGLRIFKGKLVVMGQEGTLHSSISTLINLEDQKEIDSIAGFGNKLSATGRFLGYRMFYPSESAEPPRMSDLVLIYDLSESPDRNRMKGQDAYRNDPVGRLTEVGHPIYPEGNATKKHYRVWVLDENDRHSIVPDGFFWLEDDRKIAFVDRAGGENYLIVVDLAAGLDRPVIHKKWIDVRSLLMADDGPNEALVHEAKRLRLEDVRPINSGAVRIRITSAVPLSTNDLDLTYQETERGRSPRPDEPAPLMHAPIR